MGGGTTGTERKWTIINIIIVMVRGPFLAQFDLLMRQSLRDLMARLLDRRRLLPAAFKTVTISMDGAR